MPWNATTLAGALGGLVSSANAAIDQIQAQLSKLDAQVNKLNSDLNTAVEFPHRETRNPAWK
jgi:outer membrane murein-binding lipoprotein Lpp